MTTDPDIFDVIKHRNTFRAALLYTAMGHEHTLVNEVIKAIRPDGNHEVLLTINGVKLSAFAVIDWLERGFDECVARKAEELLCERTGGRLDQAANLIEDFQRKLRDLISAPAAAPPIEAPLTKAPVATIGGRHDAAIRVVGGRECRAPAAVEIHPSGGHYEDYVHACFAHTGALLGHFPDQPDPHHYEVREVTDEERARGWRCGHVDVPKPELTTFVDVVFDGPPSHEAGRFVETEDPSGHSINVGEWIDRGNGLWALRIPQVTT